ncbi:MAG: KH domain-containing protein [Nanoarchaeota archaeon]|nr:KH domain-containing protein [Nanoarchaeota archaeon]MBU4283669.1 KH domain-containing protein [Nanoarchaeota archaeon]MBU4492798.1 KH domain-containing protein [Nanoarchaeota archaeon]
MAEYMYGTKIPKERIAVLIGTDGITKKQIESATNIKLKIDSKEGDVFLEGEDALGLYSAREVVKAIGRGFNPDIALLLLKQDYMLEMINMADYIKSKNQMIRLKGRVIGAEGRSRKTIEELTETYISVYGKTIGIIGFSENVAIAKRAVESLLSGSPHSSVYKWLEKRRSNMKRRDLEIK